MLPPSGARRKNPAYLSQPVNSEDGGAFVQSRAFDAGRQALREGIPREAIVALGGFGEAEEVEEPGRGDFGNYNHRALLGRGAGHVLFLGSSVETGLTLTGKNGGVNVESAWRNRHGKGRDREAAPLQDDGSLDGLSALLFRRSQAADDALYRGPLDAECL